MTTAFVANFFAKETIYKFQTKMRTRKSTKIAKEQFYLRKLWRNEDVKAIVEKINCSTVENQDQFSQDPNETTRLKFEAAFDKLSPTDHHRNNITFESK